MLRLIEPPLDPCFEFFVQVRKSFPPELSLLGEYWPVWTTFVSASGFHDKGATNVFEGRRGLKKEFRSAVFQVSLGLTLHDLSL